MELPQSAPTENTLLSFIKTFLCPELSSWLHQMPAESPPVLLASGPDLKHWLCISRANLVYSVNKCQQVWRVQGSRPGVGTGRKEGLPVEEMTRAVLYLLPVKTHSCLAPMVLLKRSNQLGIGRMPLWQMGLSMAKMPSILCIKCLC